MPESVGDKIDEFFSRYPVRSYPKGQILVFADESPDHIFYVKRGRVRQYGISYRGDEVIVNIFKPPAFFPMSWALNRTPNKYFFKTEVDTTLHIVPPDDALKFLQDNPDVTLDLLSRIYKGLDGVLGRMVHLMSSSARNRLVYELIVESRRFGEQGKDGSYVLSISEADLAARAGLTRETVSREMKQLKARSGVLLKSKQIVITDLSELQKLIGEMVDI